MSSEISKSIESYVAAEMKIREAKRKYVEEKSDLKERINTCKQFLLEQMCHKNISCMEVKSKEDGQVAYIRIKYAPVGTRTFSHNDMMNLLREVSYNYDTTQNVVDSIRTLSTNTETKPTLEISPSKERGAELFPLPSDLKDVAYELISCKHKIKELSASEKGDISAYDHIKQQHHDSIVNFLKTKDSLHMIQRLSIPCGDETWTYFLRCVESARTKPIKLKELMELTTPHLSSLTHTDLHDRSCMSSVSQIMEEQFCSHKKTNTVKTYSLLLQKGPLKQK